MRKAVKFIRARVTAPDCVQRTARREDSVSRSYQAPHTPLLHYSTAPLRHYSTAEWGGCSQKNQNRRRWRLE